MVLDNSQDKKMDLICLTGWLKCFFFFFLELPLLLTDAIQGTTISVSLTFIHAQQRLLKGRIKTLRGATN